MFRKLTPFEHHQSFMPFDLRFMTKEQYEEFVKKTHPPDVPVVIQTKEPEKQQVDEVEEESKNN